MKLRSGFRVAQVANSAIAQNPKTFQAITEHNASTSFLMLPQEIKNRIYYFLCGGQMVHILQNDRNNNHVHGGGTVKLSHAICMESIPEEQIQKDFDSADPDTVKWNIATIEDRHDQCNRPGSKPNQLSLTHLSSCRQIYFEANTVHYANNTFAIHCNQVLERFLRARFQHKQNLAIRSLYLDVCVTHESSVNVWSNSINKTALNRLKNVRRLHLNFEQFYCKCSVDFCGYEGSEMTERQATMFKKFSKLPLKEATLIINDDAFERQFDEYHGWDHYDMTEELYRWTMKQKQEFSREVRDVLLGREDGNKGKQKGKAT